MSRSPAGTPESQRKQNRRRVIDVLREGGAQSRADIVRRTGLSRQTVSSLVAGLQVEGLVVERESPPGERGAAPTGRPPTLLALEGSTGAAVGIDFGHSHLRVAVSDLSHELLAERTRTIDVDHSSAQSLDAAAEMVDQALDEAGVGRGRIVGVGMGVPGPIRHDTGTVGSSGILPAWVGLDAAREMSRRLDLPVHVDNDATLGALAELSWGAGRGLRDFVYLKLASGVGAGLVLDGHVYRGARGGAGEIGHTVIDPAGALCRCGGRGCLETVASAGAVTRMVGETREGDLGVSDVLRLAAAGDRPALRALGDAGREIGRAVAGLCNLLNPERVIVGGDLSCAGEALLEPLEASLRRYALPAAADDVDVVQGELGERAEVLGAIALALRQSDQFFVSRDAVGAAAS